VSNHDIHLSKAPQGLFCKTQSALSFISNILQILHACCTSDIGDEMSCPIRCSLVKRWRIKNDYFCTVIRCKPLRTIAIPIYVELPTQKIRINNIVRPVKIKLFISEALKAPSIPRLLRNQNCFYPLLLLRTEQ